MLLYSAGATEATVAVGLDLYIGLDVPTFGLGGDEVQVLDGQSSAEPLTLVVGLDA